MDAVPLEVVSFIFNFCEHEFTITTGMDICGRWRLAAKEYFNQVLSRSLLEAEQFEKLRKYCIERKTQQLYAKTFYDQNYYTAVHQMHKEGRSSRAVRCMEFSKANPIFWALLYHSQTVLVDWG